MTVLTIVAIKLRFEKQLHLCVKETNHFSILPRLDSILWKYLKISWENLVHKELYLTNFGLHYALFRNSYASHGDAFFNKNIEQNYSKCTLRNF